MGGSSSVFKAKELEEYQELTYFTKNEILHVYKRFRALDERRENEDSKNSLLSMEEIQKMPELTVNPFKDRICRVFSSAGTGEMTFEDFLDMMSVFSDASPKNVKVEYAFRIYDFDEDDLISSRDLREMVTKLTSDEHKLNEDQLQQLIDNILEEADLDHDHALSFAEFEHVISKSPDFINSFRIRL